MVQWSTLCSVCGRVPALAAGLVVLLPAARVGMGCRTPLPGRTAVRDGGTRATPVAYDEPPFCAATQGTCPIEHPVRHQSRRAQTSQYSPAKILVILSKAKNLLLRARPNRRPRPSSRFR